MVPCIFTVLVLLIMALLTGVFAQGKSDYAGSDMCKQCHEVIYDNYLKSIHGKKYVAGSPAKGEGCESCHGPGSAHIEKGGGKDTLISFGKDNNVKEKSSKCLKCHGDSRQMAFWDMSRHKTTHVGCDSCHSIHKAPKTIHNKHHNTCCLSAETPQDACARFMLRLSPGCKISDLEAVSSPPKGKVDDMF